jgi:hypothetical protein
MADEPIRPFYGSYGTLTDRGDKVQCHVCGRFMHHLGYHVRRSHEMSCDAYRIAFGLAQSTGLISTKLRESRQRQCVFVADPSLMARGVAESLKVPRGKRGPVRFQTKQKPGYLANKIAAGKRLAEVYRAKLAQGTVKQHVKSKEEYAEMNRRAWSVLAEKRKDPEYVAAVKAKQSKAKAVIVSAQCVVCGRVSEYHSSVIRKTCSTECRKRRRRETYLENQGMKKGKR